MGARAAEGFLEPWAYGDVRYSPTSGQVSRNVIEVGIGEFAASSRSNPSILKYASDDASQSDLQSARSFFTHGG
jgi:hypothetical protein